MPIHRISSKMFGLAIASLLALTAAVHDDLIVPVGATCIGGLNACIRPEKKAKFLNHSTIQQECRPYEAHAMSEALGVIDKYLSKEVDNADLDTNLNEVRVLLGHEIDSKADRGVFCDLFRGKYCIHRKLKSKDRDLMINSLIRLLNLEHIREYGYECDIEATRELDEANRIAKDPIGRRDRNETDFFERVDEIVFEAARQRATICLPIYKGRLHGMSVMPMRSVVRVSRCWNQVLEQRMRRKIFGDENLMNPKKALDLTVRMPNAVEPEEITSILDVFNDGHSGTSSAHGSRQRSEADMALFRFDRYLLAPCYEFIDLVSNTFESLDFDLRVHKFLPKGLVASIDHDEDISRLRLFKLMCTKLIEDRGPLEDFIKSRDYSAHYNSTASTSD